MATRRELSILLVLLALATLWSAIDPHDRLVWWMESLPVFLGLAVLVLTRGYLPLSRLSYYLLFLFALVLLVGAHYTYGRVPVGEWFQDLLDTSRNHYDRFGHVLQGLVPALVAREVLLRLDVVKPGNWLFFLACCVALSISALYELVEWQSAVWGGDSTMEFLGVQGDIWDAQWDMALALVGAITGQLLFRGLQDRQIARNDGNG